MSNRVRHSGPTCAPCRPTGAVWHGDISDACSDSDTSPVLKRTREFTDPVFLEDSLGCEDSVSHDSSPVLKRTRENPGPVRLWGKMASVTETGCMAAAPAQVASDQGQDAIWTLDYDWESHLQIRMSGKEAWCVRARRLIDAGHTLPLLACCAGSFSSGNAETERSTMN